MAALAALATSSWCRFINYLIPLSAKMGRRLFSILPSSLLPVVMVPSLLACITRTSVVTMRHAPLFIALVSSQQSSPDRRLLAAERGREKKEKGPQPRAQTSLSQVGHPWRVRGRIETPKSTILETASVQNGPKHAAIFIFYSLYFFFPQLGRTPQPARSCAVTRVAMLLTLACVDAAR